MHEYHYKNFKYCQSCRAIKGKKKESLNCLTCQRKCPEIAPQNLKSWDLFCYLKNDRKRHNGIALGFGVDYVSLDIVARILGHDLDRCTLNKLFFLEQCDFVMMDDPKKKIKKNEAK